MKGIILADPVDMQSAGVHVFTREMITALQSLKGEDIMIVREGRNQSLKYKASYVIKEYSIPGYRALRVFFLIPQMVNKIKPAFVMEPAHFGPFNIHRGIKRITMIHDLTPLKFPHWHRFHSQLLQRIFLPGILRRADLIITNSNNTKNDLVSFFPWTENKTERIYLGKEEIYKPVDARIKDHFSEIKNDYFLFVGTLEPRKNINSVLEAFKQFKAKSKNNHQLVIVGGKGWKSKDMYQTIKKHPFLHDIVMTGYVAIEYLPVLYSSATAFIYPSFYEGFGFPVLEAMACGAPCITSNVSSLPEVGGDAVLYVDPNSIDDIAEKMEMIIKDNKLRDSLKKKSLDQAAKFSWDKFAKDFIYILSKKFKE
ncbi:MAG: glycosyltransferase family 4 protein [Bacteroidales bacterium]|nr:glycosyltransferase family 4 protein [Bacteroidales bacterium]MCF8398610.1 glycosyltransferase family 4 protein [Bacteroidales bacterium]